jgi:hypothetical protein
MKKLLLPALLLIITTAGFAQSDRYNQSMKNALEQFSSAGTPDAMLAVSQTFERIGDAEKTQWLPYYYASLTYVLHAFMKNTPETNDTYATKAEELINKAEALEKKNSEIACVKSLIASLRMIVDPQTRWQTYGTTIQQEIETAKSLDPANPRPWYLQGQNLRHTPQEFGGGCAAAKPLLEEALKRYESFKPASELHPNWGKDQVTAMLEECK